MSKIWICRICGSGCFYERKPPKNDPIWKCGDFNEEKSKDDDDHDRITLHLPPGKEPNVEIQRKIKDLDIILTIENLTK